MSSPAPSMTVLSYPKALPDLGWFKHQLLWVDRVELIWPNYGEPEPMTPDEEFRLKQLLKVRHSCDLLTPRHVYYESIGKLEQDLRRFQPGDLPVAASKVAQEVEHAERFMYRNKLGPGVEEALLRKGVLTEDEKSGHYLAKPGFVSRLLHAVAEKFAEESGAELCPDNTMTYRNASEPGDAKAPSFELCIPRLPRPRKDSMSVDAILELRSSDRYERARVDYLNELYALYDAALSALDHFWDDSEVTKLFDDRVRSDYEIATQSLIEYHKPHCDLTGALVEVGAVVMGATPETWDVSTAAALALPVATAAWSMRRVTTRPRSSRLLRRMYKAADDDLVIGDDAED